MSIREFLVAFVSFFASPASPNGPNSSMRLFQLIDAGVGCTGLILKKFAKTLMKMYALSQAAIFSVSVVHAA